MLPLDSRPFPSSAPSSGVEAPDFRADMRGNAARDFALRHALAQDTEALLHLRFGEDMAPVVLAAARKPTASCISHASALQLSKNSELCPQLTECEYAVNTKLTQKDVASEMTLDVGRVLTGVDGRGAGPLKCTLRCKRPPGYTRGMNTPKRKKAKVATTEAVTPQKRHEYQWQLPTRVSPEMRQVLQALADKERRPVAQIVLFILEEGLAQKGLWPPKPAEEGGAS